MSLDDRMAHLARTPLFSLMERDALRLLAFAAEERELRVADVLFRKGDRSDGGHVVTRGAIALDIDGSEPVFVAEPGALIGRTALFNRSTRPATAVARAPSTSLRISPPLMRRVLEAFPAAAREIHAAMDDDLSELARGLERVRGLLLAVDGDRA